MSHHSYCPLCGSSSLKVLHTCTDRLVSHDRFDITCCGTCGFLFTQDPPDEKDAGKYYESDDYISHTDSRKTFLDRIYQLVRSYMLGRKKRLTVKCSGKETGTLLDIGCGTGHFLNAMKSSGWSVSGIEINGNARSYAEGRFGLNVIHPGRIRDIGNGTFDCITMWHVAEHLYDIDGMFMEAKRMLRSGGKMIVALPNSSSFDAIHYRENWAAWDVPRHLWHFSPDLFRTFAEKAGFRLTGTGILPFDVFYISILSSRGNSQLMKLAGGMFHGMAFSFLALFNRKRASSVVYVLEPAC